MATKISRGIKKQLEPAGPELDELTKLECCELNEPERYELSEPPRYNFELGRRGFLGVAGAGLLISVARPAAQAQSREGREGNEGLVAARVRIAQDGSITVMTGKVEVGQGARAELTQTAAEELKVKPDDITLIMADTATTPDDGATAGSRTTPSSVPAVRRGTAAAREILIELAAKQWGVESASLKAENGAIVDAAANRRITYAELAAAANLDEAFQKTVPRDVTVTAVEDWTVSGVSTPRPNGRDIVTGAHRYPSDITRPGMLYGKVLRPPSYGAVLETIDLAVAEKMPGVVAVRDRNFVGCAAPTSFQAKQAVEALAKTASWKEKPQPSHKELYTLLKEKAATREAGRRGFREDETGSVDEGRAAAAKTLDAAYEIAYVQHAPMEPRAAMAEWNDGALTVWTGTQRPTGVQSELAETFRIPEAKVRVIVPDTGGGFGGKHTGETAIEAARLAKAAGKPVSLRWTREEEFTWAYFRPAGLIEISGGLDAEGRLVSWEFVNYNSGGSALESPYDIAHTKHQYRSSDSPLREGSYRALASTANNFARESFMDELAAAANQDPLDFRLAHLSNKRLRPVLEAVAERFRWRERRKNLQAGNPPVNGSTNQPIHGLGLACGTEKGSYVAACAEVSVDREKGTVQIHEICQAFECGAIHDPENLRKQSEGAIVMTLGAVLREEILFENGRILNPHFAQYPVPRFEDVPPIETIYLNRTDLPSVGAGETPMIAVPPAVGNAIYDATKVRVRSLPIRAAALKRA
jgi:CO/xanthine dehydrogenase Mo-binding subunit